MAICRICSQEFPDRRLELGFDTCQACGDLLAAEEIRQKQKWVGPLYNKGSVNHYLGSPEQLREVLKTSGGRKNVPLDHSPVPPPDSTRHSSDVKSGNRHNKQDTQPRETSKYVFSHWQFPVDPKTGIRYKRAVLKRRE
jgi:hypothetical protein